MTRSVDDTIAAIATPPGQGGIAIVRVSGPASAGVASSILRSSTQTAIALVPRRATLCFAVSGDGTTIDEVVAIFMDGPHSHTREDVLEIQSHGGRVAANLVLNEAMRHGARLAEPGEFTLRAFLNGRIDLVQAEAVADVIGAVSAQALKVHEALLGGALSAVVADWQEGLGRVLATLEAHLDFPEDDIEEPDHRAIEAELAAIAAAMEAKLSSYAWGRVAREGFRVAIVGAPNVGKSSLLNRLTGEERAIVSPKAGTTRDTIEVAINAFGAPVRIVDTAGLRASEDEIEGEGISRARREALEADLAVIVADASATPSEEALCEARGVIAAADSAVLVLNKCDLGSDAAPVYTHALGVEPVLVSARTGEGIERLLKAIRDRALSGAGTGTEAVLTRERHRTLVEAAKREVATALALLASGGRTDVAASTLHSARLSLRTLLGWGAPEDVLDRIFADFCIGK